MNNIHEWIFNNMGHIEELIEPILKQKNEALSQHGDIFRDEILKQCRDNILSVVSVDACKGLGCSTEDFYQSAEDLEELWKTMICY